MLWYQLSEAGQSTQDEIQALADEMRAASDRGDVAEVQRLSGRIDELFGDSLNWAGDADRDGYPDVFQFVPGIGVDRIDEGESSTALPSVGTVEQPGAEESGVTVNGGQSNEVSVSGNVFLDAVGLVGKFVEKKRGDGGLKVGDGRLEEGEQEENDKSQVLNNNKGVALSVSDDQLGARLASSILRSFFVKDVRADELEEAGEEYSSAEQRYQETMAEAQANVDDLKAQTQELSDSFNCSAGVFTHALKYGFFGSGLV